MRRRTINTYDTRFDFTAAWRVAALCICAFGWPAVAHAQANAGKISPEAREYIEDALKLMESRSINRAIVDWEEIRADAYEAAAGAQTTWDTYGAVTQALVALGTNHSFLNPSPYFLADRLGVSVADVSSAFESSTRSEPEGSVVGGAVGHLRIPGFSGSDPDRFATDILSLVRDMDAAGVCGWVVDLRGNGGGNMWPMMQGVMPILGDATAGYFRHPEGERVPWEVPALTGQPYDLRVVAPPVAVLYDGGTASSGEAVAVAFRGRPRTRSFGEPTAGLSTSNASIPLSDGAVMILTTSTFEDRTGVLYGGPIQPDQVVPAEAALEPALDWLRTSEGCGASR